MLGNPLHDGLRIEPTPGPTTFVIFGASGDLTRRKLLPAIYRLMRRGRLPARFAVIGIARSQMDDEAFRTQFRESLKEFAGAGDGKDEIAESLASRMYYLAGETNDPQLYQRLQSRSDGDRRRRRRTLLSRDSSHRLFDGHRAAGIVRARRSAGAWVAAHRRREAVRNRP